MKPHYRWLPALVAPFCLLSSSLTARCETAPAATEPVCIPFPMGEDTPNCGVADVSRFTEKPAGKNGRLRVDADGHFTDATGRRVRLLGTNITSTEAFPSHERAEALASRLASLGINAVRFHHIDTNPAPRGLWKNKPVLDEFDPEQLDKLDYFIAQLKANGIYVDLNLHVSYSYWRGKDYAKDGLKDNEERNRLLPTFGKGVDRIEDDFIEQQKDFARNLLGHKNPYTGLTYAEDPVIAIVEINNENSLHELKVKELPAWYRGRIQAKFNAWLRRKYGTTAALQKAWKQDIPLSDTELLVRKPGSHPDRCIALEAASPQDVTIQIKETAGASWAAEITWHDLPLEENELYTLTFETRSEDARSFRLHISYQQADWHNCGLATTVEAGPEWTRHQFSFNAANTVAGQSRLVFAVGHNVPGVIEVRGVSLRKGGSLGLAPEESLEAGIVDLSSGGTADRSPRAQDWKLFALQTELLYGETLRNVIRKEAGYGGLLLDTQCTYGGLPGLLRETAFDIIDTHSYWQHPEFIGKAWGPNWVVRNRSMANVPQNGSNLGSLAVWRVAGMPFTVSEYNHSAPNLYQAEMFPMLSVYAALQDWDGIFQFDWGVYRWDNNRIAGFFALQSNPLKLAFLPAAAVIYRAAAVAPLNSTAHLTLPGGAHAAPFAAANTDLKSLWFRTGLSSGEYVSRRLSVGFDPSAHTPRLTRSGAAAPGESPLTWEKGSFRLDAPAAKAIVGSVTGKTHTFTDAAITLTPSVSGFAALTLTAMDLQPVRASRSLLLTAVGSGESTDTVWKEDRTSVRSWGKAPTLCEAIIGTAAIHTDAETATVYALDGKGNRKSEVPSTLKDGVLTFSMGPEHATIWYEIAAR